MSFLVSSKMAPAAEFASKDPSRYALSAVKLSLVGVPADKPDTVRAESTDGKRMIRVEMPADKVDDFPRIEGFNLESKGETECVILADDFKGIFTKLPKRNGKAILENAAVCPTKETMKVNTVSTDLQTQNAKTLKQVEGTFPNFDDVFPTAKAKFSVWFSPKLLGESLRTLEKLGAVNVKFEFTDGASPAKMTAETSEGMKIKAVIMPMSAG